MQRVHGCGYFAVSQPIQRLHLGRAQTRSSRPMPDGHGRPARSLISLLRNSGGRRRVVVIAVDPGVVHDAKQPRLEVRPIAERSELGVRLQHRFLDQIFGIGRRTRHPPCAAV